ncbi:MAG: Xaa-Pro peptidase family protein [Oscillospiraceae bacterium]|nr:Xaa-Pro peptidase family protein [Oscillospiraceae bacterium]
MIDRLQEALFGSGSDVEADGALITSAPNCRYLSGFPATSRMVFVTRDAAYFLTDFRYGEAARKKVQGCTVVEYQDSRQTLRELVRRHDCKRILFEYDNLRYSEAERYRKFCDHLSVTPVFDKTLDSVLQSLRAIKQPQEIASLKAAQAITDASFQHILPYLKPGVTERELALEIEFFMKKQGAEDIAFDLIVVSGENGSQCHGVPGDKPVHPGDFITMDIGAVIDGYHSDMTRTVALGYVTEAQKQVYDTVLQAQQAAVEAVRPDVPCRQIDWVARSIINEHYSGAFGHATGHSVGIEIHEWPTFSPSCETLTQPGMVITVEPGIYLEGQFGVRIEDMVLVMENGHENLTGSPKELIIL